MRILWLHQFFATPKGWGAVRTYEFARRFVKAGHSVDVVCCAGYDASLKGSGGAPVTVDGVRVFVSGTGYRPQMGFARRVWSFLCFMTCALWFVARRGGGYDVMIASSGPLSMAVPALAGRWVRRLPFVFEVIDVWPDSAIAAGVLKNPVLKWLSFRLESLAYKYASAIVTCSTGMTERVEKKLGVRSEEFAVGECEDGERSTVNGGRSSKALECGSSKVVTISNCCDVDQFVVDADKRQKTRERLGVREGQTVVLYTGAMGLSNEIPDLVEAVQAMAGDERIVWWFAGSGPEAEKLQNVSHRGTESTEDGGESSLVHYCERSFVGVKGDPIGNRQSAIGKYASIGNRFLGKLSKEQVLELYLAADVNMVTFMHEPLFYENSPNKFFDGIAAGLPTVFNRTTWLEPWLKEYDCGVVCKGDRPGQEMAEAIRRLAGDKDRREKMGQGARRLAEEVFDRDTLADKYLGILRGVLRYCEARLEKRQLGGMR